MASKFFASKAKTRDSKTASQAGTSKGKDSKAETEFSEWYPSLHSTYNIFSKFEIFKPWIYDRLKGLNKIGQFQYMNPTLIGVALLYIHKAVGGQDTTINLNVMPYNLLTGSTSKTVSKKVKRDDSKIIADLIRYIKFIEQVDNNFKLDDQ